MRPSGPSWASPGESREGHGPSVIRGNQMNLQDVGGEGTGLALGLGKAPAPSLQGGAHARAPAGRFQLRPLVGLGDAEVARRREATAAPEPARAAR